MNFDVKRMLKFELNVGDKEKKIRMGVGAGLVFISLLIASITLLIIGLALIVTGYTGWCPAYSGLGRNTCAESKTK